MAEQSPAEWGAQPIEGGDHPLSWGAQPVDSSPPTETPSPPTPRTWSGAVREAMGNIPSSAYHFGKDLVQPFIHPVDTATNMYHLGRGAMQKLGLVSGEEDTPYANAVGEFLVNRYGSRDAIKNTIATDPVGLAADLSMFLSGGETAVGRLPGLVGRAGEIAGTVGRTVDPLAAAAKGVMAVGKPLAAKIVGEATGVGRPAIELAAQAGYEGGEAGRAFRENINASAPTKDTVNEAREAVRGLKKERGLAYNEAMEKNIRSDPTILDFNKVDEALADVSNVKKFKGQVLDPETQAIRDRITKEVADWKALDPAEYHTAEGLDALKQKIGSIKDATEYGSPDRVVADRAYNALHNTITEQAPEYAKIMKGYGEASDLIKAMEKELSLNPRANVDTSLRKLQSVLRNNVSSAYGRRAELADYLVRAGAPNLLYKIAGQALQPTISRGLTGLLQKATAGVGAHSIVGGLAGVHSLLPVGVGMMASAPLMSPRLMGEGAYWAGKGAKALENVPVGDALRGARAVGEANEQLAFARGGSVQEKLSHEAAGYHPGQGPKGSHCAVCAHYLRGVPPHCQIVVDPIRPQDGCQRFEKRAARAQRQSQTQLPVR